MPLSSYIKNRLTGSYLLNVISACQNKTGSLMGDPALLLTLYPSLPASKPALNATGEFIFLLDRSGSMTCNIGDSPNSPSRIQSAKVQGRRRIKMMTQDGLEAATKLWVGY